MNPNRIHGSCRETARCAALLVAWLSLQACTLAVDEVAWGERREVSGPTLAVRLDTAAAHVPRPAPRGVRSIRPRHGRDKPVVAIIGANSGTETTYYTVPYGVLSGSGVADVWALSTGRGPIRRFPALTIDPGTTTADFDASVPGGSDIVIVSASVQMSLALVEAIAGTDRALRVAAQIGASAWSATHDSDRFGVDVRHPWTAASNWLAFWRNEEIALPIRDGVDEITLALIADAWSRTYRSQALSIRRTGHPITTRRGRSVVPDSDPTANQLQRREHVVGIPATRPVLALEQALGAIEERYGSGTRAFVARAPEHPDGGGGRTGP